MISHHFYFLCLFSLLDGPPSLIKSGKSYMLYLEALRNEFKVMALYCTGILFISLVYNSFMDGCRAADQSL